MLLPEFQPMPSDLPTRYSASPAAIGERLGGETAILHVESGIYFGLKGVGIDVWAMLEQSPTLDEIVARLTGEYDVDPARCREDVTALLDRLQAARLVNAG